MGPALRSGVFLDRDGVVNDVILRDGKGYPPPDLARLRILPGVRDALRALRRADLPLVVVTNQPDVATGLQRREVVEAMHAHLCHELPLDAIFVCYHTDEHRCRCRKPEPGMLQDAAERFGIDLGRSFMVGDRWRDIEAGRRVGCTTFWIDRGYAERKPERPDHIVRDLAEASATILRELQAARTGADEPAPDPDNHFESNRGATTCDAS